MSRGKEEKLNKINPSGAGKPSNGSYASNSLRQKVYGQQQHSESRLRTWLGLVSIRQGIFDNRQSPGFLDPVLARATMLVVDHIGGLFQKESRKPVE